MSITINGTHCNIKLTVMAKGKSKTKKTSKVERKQKIGELFKKKVKKGKLEKNPPQTSKKPKREFKKKNEGSFSRDRVAALDGKLKELGDKIYQA